MKILTLEEIKKIEVELLIDLTKICEENKLRYYLTGGTLLGAVKYQGFIPWDDDIDLALPRKDFKKLIEILEERKR